MGLHRTKHQVSTHVYGPSACIIRQGGLRCELPAAICGIAPAIASSQSQLADYLRLQLRVLLRRDLASVEKRHWFGELGRLIACNSYVDGVVGDEIEPRLTTVAAGLGHMRFLKHPDERNDLDETGHAAEEVDGGDDERIGVLSPECDDGRHALGGGG